MQPAAAPDLLQVLLSCPDIPFPHLTHAHIPTSDDHLKVCTILLNRITGDTVRNAGRQDLDALVDAMIRPFPESLVFLAHRLVHSQETVTRTILQRVVDKYVYGETIVTIISEACTVPADEDRNQRLVQTLVSLPDATTADSSHVTGSLNPVKYFARLAHVLLQVLKQGRDRLSHEIDSDLSIVSNMIARLSVRGCTDVLWTELMQPLIIANETDMMMRRMSYHVLVHKAPDRSLESMLSTMFCRAKSGIPILSLIEDAVIRRDKVKYLLTEKFIQITCFPDQRFPRNLMHYLSLADRRLLVAAVKTAISCWSSSSSLKYRSLHQNLYIGSLLVCAVKFVKSLDDGTRKDLHVQLMKGMETHVNSTISDLRNSGLFVGQLLMNELDTGMPDLQLDVSEDEHVKYLKQFLSDCNTETPSQDPPISVKHGKKLIQVVGEEDDDEVDDADDLVTTMTKPVYLLDCLHGLQESEDEEWKLICLSSMEQLIRKNSKTACDLSEDIVRTLLHFTSDSHHRISALIAITSCSPGVACLFLVDQFYDRNIALCVRLDILQVLAKASIEISSGFKVVEEHASVDLMGGVAVPAEAAVMEQSWQEIVNQRIADKTRRFASGIKKIDAKANAFAPHAANFFFPLIQRFDGKDIIFLIKDFDSILLSRMLFTLSVILNSASQQLISRRMGTALLDFALLFRQHEDPLVRRAAAFSFATILIAAPASALLFDLRNQVLCMKDWLISRQELDMDNEVKQTAMRALFLLNEVIQASEKSSP